ncbi:MAG TPA: methyltransferase domain-containing protein [Stellaceae bacterium]|nr:methyltransferase domain-containing protein [Stellaceae bacterium]
MIHRKASDIFDGFLRRPGYRRYLWGRLLRACGYDEEHWVRVVYAREWRDHFASLPLQSLSVLEISPGPRPLIERGSVACYRAVNFPEFDITRDTLSEKFDLIIAEQVFEHLRHPHRAARNIHSMLKDDGLFMIATPFMIKIHGHPKDYTRWTPDGLGAFLEDCGFLAEVHSWGNKKAVCGNLDKWREYGWRRDIRNEPDLPAAVWAYARKASC